MARMGDKGFPGIDSYCSGAVLDATDRFVCSTTL
jgi:hypothetical protein